MRGDPRDFMSHVAASCLARASTVCQGRAGETVVVVALARWDFVDMYGTVLLVQ